MRVALYWTPEPADPLAQAGNTWLGRDPELGVALPQPQVHGLADATAAPRVYGFHATLRPPMRLATGWDEFHQAATDLAATLVPFDLPPLAVDDLSGFLALRAQRPCPHLQRLADACVIATDRHRLPPDAAELARRHRLTLSETEQALLARWGYPYVMQAWRFHMTLTGRLAPAEMARLRPAAERHFANSLGHPRQVRELAVFTQRDSPFLAEPASFLIAERLPFGGLRG
jgi:hypothetical protein